MRGKRTAHENSVGVPSFGSQAFLRVVERVLRRLRVLSLRAGVVRGRWLRLLSPSRPGVGGGQEVGVLWTVGVPWSEDLFDPRVFGRVRAAAVAVGLCKVETRCFVADGGGRPERAAVVRFSVAGVVGVDFADDVAGAEAVVDLIPFLRCSRGVKPVALCKTPTSGTSVKRVSDKSLSNC